MSGGTVPVSLYTTNHIWCGGNVYSTSDKYINDISETEAQRVLNIKTVSYCGKSDSEKRKQIGVIAQDLLANGLGDLVGVVANPDVENEFSYMVKYQELTIYLLRVVKSMSGRIAELERSKQRSTR